MNHVEVSYNRKKEKKSENNHYWALYMLTNNTIVNNKLNKNEYREEHIEAGDSRPNPQYPEEQSKSCCYWIF